jgi:hypothetical protein
MYVVHRLKSPNDVTLFSVPASDPTLKEALTKYHQGLITNDARIAELLLVEYGIEMK